MVDDEYEIISHRDVRKLKEELKALKSGKGALATSELQESINTLTDKLDSMIEVFESAAEELREEDKESEIIASKINPLMDRLQAIEEQNKKIAQGLVAINSVLDEKIDQINDLVDSFSKSQEDLRRTVNEAVDKIRDLKFEPTMHEPTPPDFGHLEPSSSKTPRPGVLPPLPSSVSSGTPRRIPNKKKWKFL